MKDQALAERVAGFQPDVLIVRSTKVGEPVLAAGPLKLVVRAGAGYNTIDLAAASRRVSTSRTAPERTRWRCAELAVRADSGARPAHSGQRDLAPRRPVEQGRILEGSGPLRPHSGLAGSGQHRQPDDPARESFWDASGGVEPQSQRGKERKRWALSGEIRPAQSPRRPIS